MVKFQEKYQVAVSSHDFGEPQELEVAVRNSTKVEEGIAYEAVKNVTLINGQTKMIDLDVSLSKFSSFHFEIHTENIFVRS